MSTPVSFFRNQTADPGQTIELELASPAGPLQWGLYSRSPVDAATVAEWADCGLRNDRESAEFRQRLEKVVERAGGGWIVEARPAKMTMTLTIGIVHGNGFRPAGRFLMLRPGYPPAFQPGADRPFTLRSGCHVVVPVDDEAERHLQILVEHLHWLSPDIEALVFNTLSQPSLGARLDRLEQKLDAGRTARSGASVAASRKSRFGQLLAQVAGWLKRPLPLGPVLAAALALALLANLLGSAWMSRLVSATISAEVARLDSRPPALLPGAPPTDVAGGDEDAGPDGVRTPLPEALDRLMEVLAKFPADTPEGGLYASHFAPHRGAQMLQQPAVGYGFVKLVALRRGDPLEDGLVRDVGTESATKELLRNLRRGLSDEELWMLAHVTCLAFPDNREENIAGLPFEADHRIKRRVVLPAACENHTSQPEVAVPGILELADFFGERLAGLTPSPPPEPPNPDGVG